MSPQGKCSKNLSLMAPQVKRPNVNTLDPVYTYVSPVLSASEDLQLEPNPAYTTVELCHTHHSEDVAGETSGDGVYENPV